MALAPHSCSHSFFVKYPNLILTLVHIPQSLFFLPSMIITLFQQLVHVADHQGLFFLTNGHTSSH
jgi:hypothetical protein